MAINQIKVANEAKQDITISKADQILGRLADQTIVAKTVKSIQRGLVSDGSKNSATGRYEFATVNPVGYKYVLLIDSTSEYNSSVVGQSNTRPLCTAELIGNKICSEVVSGSSAVDIQSFKWTLIEFY